MHSRTLVTFGETMGRLDADGIGLLDGVRPLSLKLAGAESNVAIAAARLGADVTWVGRVGPDGVGDLIERRLRGEGVRTRALRDAAFTGLMISSRRTSAGVRVDYHRAGSAGSRLRPSDLPRDLIAGAGVLHVTGITPALSAGAREATFYAVEVARAAGVTVSLDINHRAKLWSAQEAAPVLRDLVRLADLVFAGPEEARLVLHPATEDDRTVAPEADNGADRARSSLALAHAVAALGPATVVIKDGPRGAVAVVEGGEHLAPPVPVQAVDPVGAGDAFVGGYLADLLAGADPGQCLTTAARTGAYAVTVPGDCEHLPYRHELTAFAAAEDVAR
ncbi:sugar kinase [Occultella glacieicola]|uniref:Sugar kinase n=1 Tax=Occultella glacieicola TaxID=2518684 RepID=A0ABY2E588_9MICO|nr:sugar kinase [Occultella glacieicola]TDE95751.1 sugar kinase [Occultella glacieicola]